MCSSPLVRRRQNQHHSAIDIRLREHVTRKLSFIPASDLEQAKDPWSLSNASWSQTRARMAAGGKEGFKNTCHKPAPMITTLNPFSGAIVVLYSLGNLSVTA